MYCLTCAVPTDLLEIATGVCTVCGMQGCVEEPHENYVTLTFYFESEENAASAKAALTKNLPADNLNIDIKFIDDNQDWNAKWRESMEPAHIANGVWVSPVWLAPPKECNAWIKIEPKMAFGTGHHESTRLAAKAILACKEHIAGKSVLDIGTGSGVLCFVADYAGAKNVVGVELDIVCLENLAENKRDNPPRNASGINFVIGTLDSICAALESTQKFDAVIMNMLERESTPLLSQIVNLLKENAIFVWSGILAAERNEVIAKAEKFGFTLMQEQTENEWWSGALTLHQLVKTPRLSRL